MDVSTSPTDNGLSSRPRPEDLIVVGLGASAGGIEALIRFFENVQPSSGLVYVVILHLSPEHDSQLASVLQNAAPIPVTQVKERVRVEPDHVYVVPPNQHLEIAEDFITVSPNLTVGERRAPVDIFFRALAESYEGRAVAVILSGTGANGSNGLKRVKERGGATFVQNPREAQFNEMPRHAIATDLVDEVLPVAEIPGHILQYKNSLGVVEIPVEPANRSEEQQQALREIFTQLRLRTGHDFSNYKRPTVLRRIERRVNVRRLPSLAAYAHYMGESPDEAPALLKDLLISVTNFFRDARSFEALENNVLPLIMSGKSTEDQVRVWVSGCATGEEAYSIAMLLAERTLGVIDAPKVQIFATDIDEDAIATAREGLYTLNDTADISPERLRRFFSREGDSYRVRREIREMILFAHHNVLKDPPFSHLDMVTCRNLLIYLNSTAQERIMETFHFALNPGGYLFLGASESADGASDLYANVSREFHIYQSRQVGNRLYPAPESSSTFRFESMHVRRAEPSPLPEKQTLDRISYGELHQQLLEQYAPPSVVVNDAFDIVHLSDRVGRYLEVTGGELSNNLLKLIRPELRLELRTALYQAVQRNTNVDARNLKLGVGESAENIIIRVRPVLRQSDTARGFLLVLFEHAEPSDFNGETLFTSDEPVARQLEEELMRAKEQLRTVSEQYEAQAEELRASNEELQAMNEELRSAAEELETSKEELQSINEELRTVNQELKVKVEEATHTSNNLQNLVNSTDIGTIFLDRGFRVNLFTASIREIFNLLPSDVGRPISDITNKLESVDLIRDGETVLDRLQAVEREVRSTDGRVFMMRVLPYRTAEDRINGVVVTFFDITERTHAEQALRESEERMRLLLESAKDYAIFTNDPARRVRSWNAGATGMFGYSEEEIIGQSGDVIFTPEDRTQKVPEQEAQTAREQGQAMNERIHVRKDGSHFYGSGTTRPLWDKSGNLVGFVKIIRDLTEQKARAEALRESEERFRLFVEASSDAIYRMSADWTEMYNLVGMEFLSNTSNPNRNWLDSYIPAEARPAVMAAIQKAIRTRSVFELEHQVIREDGTVGWTFSRSIPVLDEQGEILEWFGAASDITARKEAEAALSEHVDELTRFNRAVTQRELRMIDLKKEVNELAAQQGEEPRYSLNFEDEERGDDG